MGICVDSLDRRGRVTFPKKELRILQTVLRPLCEASCHRGFGVSKRRRHHFFNPSLLHRCVSSRCCVRVVDLKNINDDAYVRPLSGRARVRRAFGSRCRRPRHIERLRSASRLAGRHPDLKGTPMGPDGIWGGGGERPRARPQRQRYLRFAISAFNYIINYSGYFLPYNNTPPPIPINKPPRSAKPLSRKAFLIIASVSS